MAEALSVVTCSFLFFFLPFHFHPSCFLFFFLIPLSCSPSLHSIFLVRNFTCRPSSSKSSTTVSLGGNQSSVSAQSGRWKNIGVSRRRNERRRRKEGNGDVREQMLGNIQRRLRLMVKTAVCLCVQVRPRSQFLGMSSLTLVTRSHSCRSR